MKKKKDIIASEKLVKIIRIIGAGYWRKGKKIYEKKIKYSNEDIGKVEVIKDFLPKPDELVFKEENVKVTLNLSKSSVEFFKKIAREKGSQYQKVIRNLLYRYTSHYSN